MHVSRFVFVLCSTAEEGFEGVEPCEFDAGLLCLGMWVARGRGIVMAVRMEEEGVLIDVCKCGSLSWPWTNDGPNSNLRAVRARTMDDVDFIVGYTSEAC